MKRKHVVVLVAVVAVLGLVAALSVRWWRRQHSFSGYVFQAPAVATAPARLRLLPVATGFDRPTDVQFVPGGGTRAIVLEQTGHGRLIDVAPALAGGKPDDAHTAPLVIDVWVRSLGEMGLLGLAFHPHYQQRGTIYVYYDPWTHDILRSRIAEFKLPFETLGKQPAVETRTLLELDQDGSLHQGGQVAFGPDGKLYIGIGDSSPPAGDTHGWAQKLDSLHGKLLRLDVDAPNIVPQDNPFVGRTGARPEVWAYGLRNPWRFSFDSTGQAIVGDIGHETREELDLVKAGANMGWNHREGRICHPPATQCPSEGLTDPVFDYDRTVGSCIIAGYVVTGKRLPELTGKYVFADFVRGRIWSMRLPATAPAAGAPPPDVHLELLGEWPRLFSAFAQDAAGDLYVVDIATGEMLALMPLK
jgi:glucose/arabinose dehydrogenase